MKKSIFAIKNHKLKGISIMYTGVINYEIHDPVARGLSAKTDFPQVFVDRAQIPDTIFDRMDWERDSIMRELDGAAVPQLCASRA